jgi:hypothetical protein
METINTLWKRGADLSALRPIIDGLRAKEIISQDEVQALIENLAAADKLDRTTLEEASGMTSEKDQVMEALAKVLREDVGPMESLEPEQPKTEPQLAANLINNLLSS